MSGLATAGCEAIVLNELNVAKRAVVADNLPKGWSLACAEGPDVKYDTTCLALALAPNMVKERVDVLKLFPDATEKAHAEILARGHPGHASGGWRQHRLCIRHAHAERIGNA